MTPKGIAVLHQLRASSLTKRIICCLLISKNLVRWATLLFMLLEIINTPAISIRINNTTATENNVCTVALLLNP